MLEKFILRFLRWRAIRKMIWRYRYLSEVNKLLEEYQTQLILRGGSDEFVAATRKQLLTVQGELKSQQDFLNWLKAQ